MNIAAAFAESANRDPDKTAIFWGDQILTYRTVLDQTRRLAWALAQQGHVKPGHSVALWMKNCPAFVPALYGILGAGAVAVPVNTFLKPEEVLYILKDAGIEMLICDEKPPEVLQVLRDGMPSLKIITLAQLESLPVHESLPDDWIFGQDRQAEDLAVLIYTSGTTGHPKGAMLSHHNLLHNVESCRQVLEAETGDRFVVLLPMFHSFMLCVGVLLPMLVGGSIVVIRSLHPPKNILQEILQHQATILPSIPQFFRTLAHASLPEDLPLRVCISGGAPLPLEILREFKERMPIPLIEGYGLSEASPVVSMNPLRGPVKEGSIGKPIPNVEVSVQNDDGQTLATGEIGEICVRGGNVMQGYWNKPEETAQTLRNGWLRTGDVGYHDEDGYFYITDRMKDMLLVNGINVYPREIEEVIYQFKGVKEAAVVGVQDSRRGEHPVAFVAPVEGADLNDKDLIAFIRARLADYKVPRKVLFVDALPRNATGKVLKRSLRDQAKSMG